MKSLEDIEYSLLGLVMINFVFGKASQQVDELLTQHPVKWDKFLRLLEYHELAPFAHLTFKQIPALVPKIVRDKCENTYYCQLGINERLRSEFRRIASLFQSSGVTAVPIKGVSFLEDIYQALPVRPMVDIDLLVKEEDVPKAGRLLGDLGYVESDKGLDKEYWDKVKCQREFLKPDVSPAILVELHFNFDYLRRQNPIHFDVWENIRDAQLGGARIKMLSPEDALFSIALHQRQLLKTFCLKYSLDAALLLNKYKSSFDWDYVVKQAHRHQVRLSIFFLSEMLRRHSLTDIPVNVVKALKIPWYKKKAVADFIDKHTACRLQSQENKNLTYLKLHFFLLDSWIQALVDVLKIPKGLFIRFFGLKAGDKKTDFFYRNRFIYYVWQTIRLVTVRNVT